MTLTILNYHGLEASHGEYEWSNQERPYVVTMTDWVKHLDYLKEENYRTLNLTQTRAWLSGQAQDKSVVITFDDGLRGHFDYAFGALKLRQLTGIFFVSPDLVGQKGYVNWDHLREMSHDGFDVGSHGLTHIPLVRIDEEQLTREVQLSKRILEDQLGKEVRSFSVPRGFYHPRILRAVREAGYEYLFTSHFDVNRRGQDLLSLNRTVIMRETPMREFERIVRGDLGTKKVVERIKSSLRENIPPDFYTMLSRFKQKVLRA